MIELRLANFTDYLAIAKLHAESWRQNYRGIFSDAYLDNKVETERLEFWHKRLTSPMVNQRVCLALQNETIAGFSCLYLDDDPAFGSLLDNLHVSESCQQSGIGRLLICNCAKTVLHEGNIKKMYLWVFETNHKAKRFYDHLGGRNIQSVEKQNADGTKSNACRYVWDDVSRLFEESALSKYLPK